MQQMIKKKGKTRQKKKLNNLNHPCSEQARELCLNKSTIEVKMLIFLGCFRLLTKTLTFTQEHI